MINASFDIFIKQIDPKIVNPLGFEYFDLY